MNSYPPDLRQRPTDAMFGDFSFCSPMGDRVKEFTFGSVCSGIEAASVAWHPLGGRAVWVAEIDPYCCELLHYHYGAGRPKYMPPPELAVDAKDRQAREAAIKAVKRIPQDGRLINFGDITQVQAGEIPRVDVLVGGTPCQAFSIAGLRGSLSDARGNLTLRFVEIADAIQSVRIVWENVPGVLNTKDNAFGCFLGALVGADSPLIPGRKQKWTRAGVVDGPERSAAWRILDAQYFGLAQRRERVFVMASPRDQVHAAEILFEREGVQRYHPPRRETGQGTTGTLSARTQGGGGLGTDFDLGGGLYQVSPALTSSGRGVDRVGESRGQDCVVPVQRHYPEEWGPSDNRRLTCICGRELPCPFDVGVPSTGDISHCLNAGGMGRIDYETETLVTHALRADGFDASEDDHGDPGLIAFSCKNSGSDAGELSPTLRAMEFDQSHANGGGQVAIAFDTTQITSRTNRSQSRDGDPCHPLAAQGHAPAVAFRSAGQDGFVPSEVSPPIANSDGGGSGVPSVLSGWAVRRLTPIETARLQGFADTYCHVPRRPRQIDAEEATYYLSHGIDCWLDGEQWQTRAAADGPIYKAHGNSMAVKAMRWLGIRIKASLDEVLI